MTLPDWRGRTVVCIASGPSLTLEDCARVRAAGAPVVVTNSTFRTCPWADALFFFDPDWWRVARDEIRETFKGRLYTQHYSLIKGVTCVRANPRFRSFGNSGANAIALAIASGASRVVMLGYDCSLGGNGEAHHHADHPAPLRNCDTLPKWPRQFERLAGWARVPVLNASRRSALECFPRVALEDVL